MVTTSILMLAMLAGDGSQADVSCVADGSLRISLGRAFLDAGHGGALAGVASDSTPSGELTESRLFSGASVVERIRFGPGTELLMDSGGWRLVVGEEVRGLRTPSGFKRGMPPFLLAANGRFVWLASTTHLTVVDILSDKRTLPSSRLSKTSLAWQVVEGGDKLLVVSGSAVLSCSSTSKCDTLAEFSDPVRKVLRTPGGFYVLSEAGARFVPGSDFAASQSLIAGSILALCSDQGRGALAAVQSDDHRLLLYHLEGAAVVQKIPFMDALRRAMPHATREAIVAWADALVESGWEGRRSLAVEFSEAKTPALRRMAALLWRGEEGSGALARLWLLGHDPDLEVRVAAVHASAQWCKRGEGVSCRAVLSAFVNDQEKEVSWVARDLLLADDPLSALDGATAEYRLEAVSSLASRLNRTGDPKSRRALEILGADADARVREAAQLAVLPDP